MEKRFKTEAKKKRDVQQTVILYALCGVYCIS